MSSMRKNSRIAGALYILPAVLAPFRLLFITNVILVSGHTTATAANIRSHEPT